MKDNFIKNDNNKLEFTLLEIPFIIGTTKVLMYGAKKYSADNWKKCNDKKRYKDALLRHILAYLNGEENDEETGLSHLYHASCNLMFLDYLDNSVPKKSIKDFHVQKDL